jgi:hypothetical protein
LSDYFELQLVAMCFMEVTLSVCCEVPPLLEPLEPLEPIVPLLELELEGEVVPLTSISCPTWSLSLEVSPANW